MTRAKQTHQETTKDPQTESSRSQQRSVTDLPPLSDCTPLQSSKGVGGCVVGKRRNVRTLMPCLTPDFLVSCPVQDTQIRNPLTLSSAGSKRNTSTETPREELDYSRRVTGVQLRVGLELLDTSADGITAKPLVMWMQAFPELS